MNISVCSTLMMKRLLVVVKVFIYYVFTTSMTYLFGVVFRKTVVGDRCFDYRSVSHLQSQVKSRRQIMVFNMLLVLVWTGTFCRHVIGRQNVKVVVIGRLLFGCYFRSVYCFLSISFDVMYESFVRCR